MSQYINYTYKYRPINRKSNFSMQDRRRHKIKEIHKQRSKLQKKKPYFDNENTFPGFRSAL